MSVYKARAGSGVTDKSVCVVGRVSVCSCFSSFISLDVFFFFFAKDLMSLFTMFYLFAQYQSACLVCVKEGKVICIVLTFLTLNMLWRVVA